MSGNDDLIKDISDKQFNHKVKVSHLARLFQILIYTYGLDESFEKYLKKLRSKSILAYFPYLDNTYATITVLNESLYPKLGKSENCSAEIIFNVPDGKIIPIINDVIRTKDGLFGLMKLAIKYMLPGKIKVKGSYMDAIRLISMLMIGKHPMYSVEGGK